jgi:hypothetical protein
MFEALQEQFGISATELANSGYADALIGEYRAWEVRHSLYNLYGPSNLKLSQMIITNRRAVWQARRIGRHYRIRPYALSFR